MDLACEFGELPVADRHLGNQRVRANFDAEQLNGLLRDGAHFGKVQRLQAGPKNLRHDVVVQNFTVEKDVLGGGEPWDQGEFLVNHANSCLESIERVLKIDFLAIDGDLTTCLLYTSPSPRD